MDNSDLQQPVHDKHRPLVALTEPLLVTLVEDAATHVKCNNAIRELCGSNRISDEVKPYVQRVVIAQNHQEVLDKLKAHMAGGSLNSAIVISDQFASPLTNSLRARPQSTLIGEGIRSQFGDNLLGMIAITDWTPRRVPDIDRVVSQQLTPNELAQALQLTVRTLDYKTPPKKVSLTLPVTVDRVRRQVDLNEYFKLRHRVYSAMGYLDAELEASATKIEADLCDLYSIHICAMEQSDAGNRVVGAARLILIEDEDGELRKNPERIVRADPVLRRRFRPPHPQLKLPVWRSQKVKDKIAQMFRARERHGEISRVVVAASHRGTGLARLLMNYAIHEARERGLSRLFLECVPLHRPLYRKFGFVELPGTHERVVNVDKTVVAMELDFSEKQAKIGSLPVLGNTILGEKYHLCACARRECYSQEYSLYKSENCALHYPLRKPK